MTDIKENDNTLAVKIKTTHLKDKKLILTAIAFLLVLNTSYYWQGKLGFWALLVFLILFVVFVVLGILVVVEIYNALIEKFKDKNKVLKIGIVLPILLLTFFYPFGLIDFEKFEGNVILIAQREGVANCMTTLKLKDNNKFKEKSVCFGINEIKGNYNFKNDTIFFENGNLPIENDDYFKFAIIRPSKLFRDNKHLALVRFKSIQDTIGDELYIEKNELTKLGKKPNR